MFLIETRTYTMCRKIAIGQPTPAKRHVRPGKTQFSLRILTVLLSSLFWSFGIEEQFRRYPKDVYRSTRGSERERFCIIQWLIMNRFNQSTSAVFEFCMFSVFLKDPHLIYSLSALKITKKQSDISLLLAHRSCCIFFFFFYVPWLKL